MARSRYIVVDDVDSSITYNGPWFQDRGQDSVGNFGPPYGSTLHGTNNSASLSFSFHGTSVTVIGTNNIRNDSGVLDPTWDCLVDNVSIGPTKPFAYAENNWVFCSQKDLADGPHTLTVNATISKGQTFWFDNIQYVPSASVSLDNAAVIIDSLDPQLQYGSGWQALGDTANMTVNTNSMFTFSFVGVSLSWFGFIPRELPITPTTSSYSIDGGGSEYFLLRGLPTSNTATTYNQKFFETAKLPAGRHNLVVTYQGNTQTTPLTLDYLIVQNGTIANSTTTAGSTAGDTSKSNDIGAIVGGIVGGVFLIGIGIFAFIYIRRRDKRLREKIAPTEPKDIEPFPYVPVSTVVPPTSTNPSSGIVPFTYTKSQNQSGKRSGPPSNVYHGSMPSLSHTELQSINPPSSSSAGTRPNPFPLRNHGHVSVPSSSDVSTTPGMTSTPTHSSAPPTQRTGDKVQREAAATAAALQPQRRAQQPLASPPLSDDAGSRVMIIHEDSGIRLAQNEPQVVEVPPMYTPG